MVNLALAEARVQTGLFLKLKCTCTHSSVPFRAMPVLVPNLALYWDKTDYRAANPSRTFCTTFQTTQPVLDSTRFSSIDSIVLGGSYLTEADHRNGILWGIWQYRICHFLVVSNVVRSCSSRHCYSVPERIRPKQTVQDRSRQYRTEVASTGQKQTVLDRSRQYRTEADSIGQKKTVQDRSRQYRTEIDSTGQKQTVQDRSRQYRT